MGVLGADRPRHHAAAADARGRPFREPGEQIQPVYELIVTVADRLARPRPRLQPRHPARPSPAVPPRRPPQRRPAAARHPDRPRRLPGGRQALGLGAEGPVGRPGARPRVADGPAPGARPRDRLGARRRGQPDLVVAVAPGRARGPARRSCSCSTSSGSRCCPTSARIVHRPGLAMVQHTDGFGTPRPEARDVPRGRAAAAVPPGLQALLPLGHPPLHAAAGTPDHAGGQLRQLPVTAGDADSARGPTASPVVGVLRRRAGRTTARRCPRRRPHVVPAVLAVVEERVGVPAGDADPRQDHAPARRAARRSRAGSPCHEVRRQARAALTAGA